MDFLQQISLIPPGKMTEGKFPEAEQNSEQSYWNLRRWIAIERNKVNN